MAGRLLLPHILLAVLAFGQQTNSSPSPNSLQITLEDAWKRAQIYSGQIQSANFAAQIAHEDSSQAKANLLPTLSAFNQFIYTEGNGTSSGVFIANDGVHVYTEEAVVHEDLLNLVRRADLRRARAAEAVAAVRKEIASRGLRGTLIQNFYSVMAASRKVSNAQSSLDDARRFLDITTKQQAMGEVAKADVIKAQLQEKARERDYSESQVNEQKAKLALSILIFPNTDLNFDVVDRSDDTPLTSVGSVNISAIPDVRAAEATLTQSAYELALSKYAYFPSLSVDFFYGINANQFAATTDYPTPQSGRSTQPDFLVPYRHNLGYSGSVSLTVPLWNWGATRSKVRQAEIHQEQARADLALSKRQAQSALQSANLELGAASEQLSFLREETDLSQESLRLALLRYQSGEATVLEVSDAQTTLATARNALTDGLTRYNVARATLATLTGRF